MIVMSECGSATSLSSAEAKELVPAPRAWGDHHDAEDGGACKPFQRRRIALLGVSELQNDDEALEAMQTRAQSQLVGT
jgi:hypothetical protein